MRAAPWTCSRAACEPLGFDCHRLRFEGGGSLPGRQSLRHDGHGGRHLAFSGHVDVVPPGPREGWRTTRSPARSSDGRLFGRGAADMKSGVGAFAAAAARVRRRGLAGAGRVSLLITGDEERESVNGTVKLLAWAAEQGLRFDACMVGEPTSVERLGDTAKIGRRGSVSCS